MSYQLLLLLIRLSCLFLFPVCWPCVRHKICLDSTSFLQWNDDSLPHIPRVFGTTWRTLHSSLCITVIFVPILTLLPKVQHLGSKIKRSYSLLYFHFAPYTKILVCIEFGTKLLMRKWTHQHLLSEPNCMFKKGRILLKWEKTSIQIKMVSNIQKFNDTSFLDIIIFW